MMANSEMKRNIPSKETNNPWVYADAPDIDIVTETYLLSRTEEESSIGKWMIFSNCVGMMPQKNMTFHDYAWSCIQNLVENNPSSVTGIHRAKASTAWANGYEAKPNSNGVICCYTIDYSDKQLAKRAADAIRKAYDYGQNLFYKTDEDTYANKYRHLGNKNVSIYKHTIGNEMFERDSVRTSVWKLVVLNS